MPGGLSSPLEAIQTDEECRSAIQTLYALDEEIKTLRLCLAQYPYARDYHHKHGNVEQLLLLETEYESNSERVVTAQSERKSLNQIICYYLENRESVKKGVTL